MTDDQYADLVRELSRVATQVEEMHRLMKAEHEHHSNLVAANAEMLKHHEDRLGSLERLASWGKGAMAALGVLFTSAGAAILARIGLI
jgi:hypothetical protein